MCALLFGEIHLESSNQKWTINDHLQAILIIGCVNLHKQFAAEKDFGNAAITSEIEYSLMEKKWSNWCCVVAMSIHISEVEFEPILNKELRHRFNYHCLMRCMQKNGLRGIA